MCSPACQAAFDTCTLKQTCASTSAGQPQPLTKSEPLYILQTDVSAGGLGTVLARAKWPSHILDMAAAL